MRRLVLLMLCLAPVILSARPGKASRTLLLDVSTVPVAWGSSHLKEKLTAVLSLRPDLRVTVSSTETAELPPFPTDRTDIDSLINWGLEMGGRYLLVVTVDQEYLTRKKTFNLPLIFHKYQTMGIISGEYRFLDLQKNRLVAAEPFTLEMPGRQQIQGSPDDNRHDPDLHVSAPEKSRLFSSLEDKLTMWLVKKIDRLTRGR